MSSRHLFNSSGLLIVLGLALGMSARADASTKDTVEMYMDQAVPIGSPPSAAFQNAPLAAGSLTMEDVLKAHPPKKAAESATVPAATGLMISQGMNSVFQKYKVPAPPKPIKAAAPTLQPQEKIEPPARPSTVEATQETVKPEAAKAPPASVVYEPGQAPKTLDAPATATVEAAAQPLVSSTPEPGTPSPVKSTCTEKIQKWERSCAEAGYPETFIGKVYGETHTVCTDGSLQDVWVKNTCLPPEEATPPKAPATASAPAKQLKQQRNDNFLKAAAQEQASSPAPVAAEKAATAVAAPEAKAETESPVTPAPALQAAEAESPEPQSPAPASTNSEELCGEAVETLAYEAPEKNLCRVGAPSSVTGKGPWSWTCTSSSGATSSCRTLSLGATGATTESAPEAAPATPVSSAPAPSSAAAAKARFLQLPSKKAPPIPSMPVADTGGEPACGSAADQPSRTAPTNNLCGTGKASAIRGAGPWSWTCSTGKKKASCSAIKMIDGACGAADGVSAVKEPPKGLCKKGVPSSVTGEDSWTWTCGGSNGGDDVSCSAPKKATEKVENTASDTSETGGVSSSARSEPFKRPEPSEIPKAVEVIADKAPEAAPNLPEDAAPVQPPAITDAPAAAVKKVEAAKTPTIKTAEVSTPTPVSPEAKSTGPEPNSSLVLDPAMSAVLFEHLSEDIDARSRSTLDKLAVILKKSPETRISLTAYADGAGMAPHAVHRLSLARALAIRNYLGSKGISDGRIDIHAEGASAPTGYPDRVDIKVGD